MQSSSKRLILQVVHFGGNMVVLQGCLFTFIIFFRVSSASDDKWSAEVPESVMGLSGSCVVIPCRFQYPEDGKTHTEFTGIWYKENSEIIYHTQTSKIISKFKGRTSLLGDLRHKNCTLRINSLDNSDAGPYKFRIEIKGFDRFTYGKDSVSIKVKDSPEQPTISVGKEVTSKIQVTATCAISHSCPLDPPSVTWSRVGTTTSQSQAQEHGQWKLTSSLTFTPSREDHNKSLNCSVEFKGQKTVTSHEILQVQYPPYNVRVESTSTVKENGSIELTCSSDGNPPAHNFQWFSSNKILLENGPAYKLNHVSRHTEAIACTAINTVGQNNSVPQKINVLYPPEIKSESACRSETSTVCVCIVDSNPPSEVKWFGPSSAFPSSSAEQKGSITIFTLNGGPGFPSTVRCSANNSEGNSVGTFHVSRFQGSIMYFVFATPAVVIILVVISVCVARRHCASRVRRQPDQKEMKTSPKSCSKSIEMPTCDIYTNNKDVQPVYQNWGRDQDDVTSEQAEDESIYANM